MRRHSFPLLAVLYALQRLAVCISGRCPLDADEGIVGIMALRMLRGEFHAFFLGQDYMGSFLSMPSLPFLLVAGHTPLALRLGAIAAGIGVLWLWRDLFRRWGNPSAFPFFALLLVFGSEFLTTWTLRSRGGIELLLLGSLLLWLVDGLDADERRFEDQWRRWALAGAVFGLAWWTSQLIVFFAVPVLVALFLSASNRRRLREGWRPAGVLLFAVFVAASGLLVLRGTVSYTSPLSSALHHARWWLVAGFILAGCAAAAGSARHQLPRWPLLAGAGALAAYLPALVHLLGKPVLYNTTSLQPPDRWPITLSTLVFEAAASFLGLAGPTLEPLPMPVWILVLVPCVVLVAVVAVGMSLSGAVRRRDEAAAHGPAILLGGSAAAIALLAMILRPISMAPHYAVFLVFLLAAVVAWFLGTLWHAGRPERQQVALRAAAVATLVLLAGVNSRSVALLPPVPVEPLTMVRRDDREVIDFLLGRGITVAATSFTSYRTGYWEAYRLSMSSGERLRVHPVLHMPRVDDYREALRGADKTALVGGSLIEEEQVLSRAGIPFEKQRVGTLEVIWGFDKARVDELGLLSYAASL